MNSKLRKAAEQVVAHLENFYREHLPACDALDPAGEGEEAKPCDCGMDALRAGISEETDQG